MKDIVKMEKNPKNRIGKTKVKKILKKYTNDSTTFNFVSRYEITLITAPKQCIESLMSIKITYTNLYFKKLLEI